MAKFSKSKYTFIETFYISSLLYCDQKYIVEYYTHIDTWHTVGSTVKLLCDLQLYSVNISNVVNIIMYVHVKES